MQGKQGCLVALAAGLALATGIGLTSPTTVSAGRARTTAARRLEAARVLRAIDEKRRETWNWQRLMGRGRTPHTDSERRITSLAYRHWVLALWTKRARRVRRLAFHPPHLRGWLCIQRHEADWSDPNPPYYGGLQMDISFQRAYGHDLLRRKGTADNWTPLEQMWVAERAHRAGRGFYPWPNTARYCGLI